MVSSFLLFFLILNIEDLISNNISKKLVFFCWFLIRISLIRFVSCIIFFRYEFSKLKEIEFWLFMINIIKMKKCGEFINIFGCYCLRGLRVVGF